MIPDEAVEAAMSALGEAYGEDAHCREREYVVTALEAAAPYIAADAKAEGWDASTKLHLHLFGRSLVTNPYRIRP